MGRRAVIGPEIHGAGRGGTRQGYRDDGCRCALCGAWKKGDHGKERGSATALISPEVVADAQTIDRNIERTIKPSVFPAVAPPVASPHSVTTPVVIPAATPPNFSDVNADVADMISEILSALAIDADWRCIVESTVPEGFGMLRGAIDAHNRAAKFPRIQYGVHEGAFWVGAADEEPSIDFHIEVTDAPLRKPAVAPAVETVAQMPRNVPLARPREVRRGASPTVPSAPVKTANAMFTRAGDATPDGNPVWG